MAAPHVGWMAFPGLLRVSPVGVLAVRGRAAALRSRTTALIATGVAGRGAGILLVTATMSRPSAHVMVVEARRPATRPEAERPRTGHDPATLEGFDRRDERLRRRPAPGYSPPGPGGEASTPLEFDTHGGTMRYSSRDGDDAGRWRCLQRDSMR